MTTPAVVFRIDVESSVRRTVTDTPRAAVRSWTEPSRWPGLAIVVELCHALRRFRWVSSDPIGRISITREAA